MKGFRTFLRGALPSLKERACARARIRARGHQVGMFGIPMSVIDGIGAGKIGHVQVTSELGRTQANIEFTRLCDPLEAEALVNHLIACGFDVDYSIPPVGEALV